MRRRGLVALLVAGVALTTAPAQGVVAGPTALTPATSSFTFGAKGDRPVAADYTGDGTLDVAVFRPSTATWYVKGGTSFTFGRAGDVPVPGDYTGDGMADAAVFRPSNGTWYVRGGATTAFGRSTDMPVPADFTGDGKVDVAVYRPSNGTWYVQGLSPVQYGTSGDRPAPANYGGDARAEMAVFRPSNGTWYLRGIGSYAYGTSGDVPVASAWTAGALARPAVFRPSNSTWYVRGVGSSAWGSTGDVPVAGNFLGDSRADRAVFSPSSARWSIQATPYSPWSAANAPTAPSDRSLVEPSDDLSAIDCPTADWCLATGSYVAKKLSSATRYRTGQVATYANGSWTLRKAPRPPGAAADDPVNISRVSCWAVGQCTAMGFYGDPYPVLVSFTLSAGVWTVQNLPLPVAATGGGTWQDLECLSAAFCVAVGSADMPSSGSAAALWVKRAGGWTAMEPPAPADGMLPTLRTVSCSSTAKCIVTGDYYLRDGDDDYWPMALEMADGNWTAVKLPLPPDAVRAWPQSIGLDLTCPSPDTCTTVGTYFTSATRQAHVILTRSAAGWTATSPPVPADATQMGLFFNVDCPAADQCYAFGRYQAADRFRLVLYRGSGSAWAAQTFARPGAAIDGDWVSPSPTTRECPDASNCLFTFPIALDEYTMTTGVFTIADGTWRVDSVPRPKAGSRGIQLADVACPSVNGCIGVGEYYLDEVSGSARGAIARQRIG